MIHSFQAFWIPYIKDIDVKSHDYPWLEEWDHLREYVIRGIIKKEENNLRVIGFSASKPGVILEIHKLAVKPRWRQQDVGKELLQDLENSCEGWKIRAMEAVLHEENILGLEWSKRQGFRSVGLNVEYYPDKRDGILIRKEL